MEKLKKSPLVPLFFFLSMFVGVMQVQASCLLQVSPNNNGWCVGIVENGEIVDYECDEDGDPGDGTKKNCEFPIGL